MKHVLCSVIFVALIIFNAAAGIQSEQPSGSIKGRITVDGKAQPGVVVSLFKADDRYYDRRPLATAITDADGGYRLTPVPAGRYSISTHSPLFVNTQIDHNGMNGRYVSVDAGEAVEDENFALVRGGVITGRIIDTDGNPVISQAVTLIKVVDGRFTQSFRPPDQQILLTDDRGVYRVYGVLPGSYKVTVGHPPHVNRASLGGGRYSSYVQTFHPDTTDQSKASVVEVTPGGETTGVDIKVASIQKTYVATGRMVEAETGRPVPNMFFAMGMGENPRPTMRGGGYRTDEKGEFRIEIATPARITIYPSSNDESNLTGRPFSFDLTSERVTGIEVKLHRALTISGIVVAEGSNKQQKLSSLTLSVQCITSERSFQNYLSGKVREDGSFTVGGIVAGKAIIYIHGPESSLPRPWLIRIERNGMDQSQGVEVAEGESISDLRLIVAYGRGAVRGEVKIEGRGLEETNPFGNSPLIVAFRHTAIPGLYGGAQVGAPLDARSRFFVEGLLDGEYEVTLRPSRYLPRDQEGRDMLARMQAFKQRVTVTNGAEATVTILLDLSEKK
jgi:protocatechuate 3,4-dioxygenase beta subunit